MPKIGGVIAKVGPGSTPVVNKQGYTTSQSINDASLQYCEYFFFKEQIASFIRFLRLVLWNRDNRTGFSKCLMFTI